MAQGSGRCWACAAALPVRDAANRDGGRGGAGSPERREGEGLGGVGPAPRIPPPPGRLPGRRLRGNGAGSGDRPPPRRAAALPSPPLSSPRDRCSGGRPGAAALRTRPQTAATSREPPPSLPGRLRAQGGQQGGAEMVPLVRGAGGSHQWLAIVFLGLCCLLPPGRFAAPGGDYPGSSVDNLVVRKGDTAVLR